MPFPGTKFSVFYFKNIMEIISLSFQFVEPNLFFLGIVFLNVYGFF